MLLMLALPLRLLAVEITIFYWSDRHAHNVAEKAVIEGDTVLVGGAANLAGILKTLRTGATRPLTLVAGDEFTGTPVSSMTHGASEVKIVNLLGINAFVPGNHEFDFGWQSLRTVMSDANFPVLLANVRLTPGDTPLFPSDTILDDGGVKVGIVGLIFKDFTQSVIREGVIGLDVADQIAAAQDFVARRRDACDILVALTHIGIDGDSALAAAVPKLDVIIGGHSHTPIDPPRFVNGVIICQSGPYGSALGRLTLDVDTVANHVVHYKGDLIKVIPKYAPPDKKMAELVDDLESKYTRKLERQIGTLTTDWNVSRGKPSNLAQWTADAMLMQCRAKISDKIQMAVINEGNLRKELKRGPIRERDLWEICPFENPIVVFQVAGEELIRTLHYQLNTPREFLTWAGLTVRADSGRVKEALVNGFPVDPEADYTIAAAGYLWGQLDSYFGLVQGDRPFFYLPGVTQRQQLIDTVIAQQVISTATDDRWDVR